MIFSLFSLLFFSIKFWFSIILLFKLFFVRFNSSISLDIFLNRVWFSFSFFWANFSFSKFSFSISLILFLSEFKSSFSISLLSQTSFNALFNSIFSFCKRSCFWDNSFLFFKKNWIRSFFISSLSILILFTHKNGLRKFILLLLLLLKI